MRTAITGASGTGKTTLSRSYQAVCHTDDYVYMGREQAAKHVSTLFDDPAYETWEGVGVVFAIRRWLDRHTRDLLRPFDQLIVLERAHRQQAPVQIAQWRMAQARLHKDLVSLGRRGVVIVRPPA